MSEKYENSDEAVMNSWIALIFGLIALMLFFIILLLVGQTIDDFIKRKKDKPQP